MKEKFADKFACILIVIQLNSTLVLQLVVCSTYFWYCNEPSQGLLALTLWCLLIHQFLGVKQASMSVGDC